MKLSSLVLCGITGFLFVLQSCAPVYKCGEQKPERFSAGNRLMAVVQERDALCEDIKGYEEKNEFLTKRNDNLMVQNDSLIQRTREMDNEYKLLQEEHVELGKKHEDLKKEHVDLKEDYAAMLSDNFQRGHMYDERLKEAERRMMEREKEAQERLDKKEQELQKRQARIEELERMIAEQDSVSKRLNRLLREALLGFESDELTVEIQNGKVYVSMSDKLMFKSGSASVENKGKEALKVLARILNQNEDFEILVEGHTDNVPISTNKYSDNWDLSVARATSMVRILTDDYSVSPKRITASGKGEFAPRASNETAEGRAQNRRTEIILSPKLDELMNMLTD